MRDRIEAFILMQLVTLLVWNIPVVFITFTLINVWFVMSIKPSNINKKERG